MPVERASRRRTWGVVAGLLAAGVVLVAAAMQDGTAPGADQTSAVLATVPAGTALPATAECVARIDGTTPEVRPENAVANARAGDGVRVPDWTPEGYAPEFNREILPRIDGDFVGSTGEILEWGACKWGLPPDVVRAMAVEESGWRQSTTGDVSSDPGDCVAGDGPPCVTSFGILQVKHLYRPGSYPLSAQSTAFNVDYALGVVRGCYEGWVTYLDGPAKGDLWGCVGWHYSGEWRDPAALGYIERVRAALDDAAWTRW